MRRRQRILFVDDDKNYVQQLVNTLKGLYNVDVAYSEREFWRLFKVGRYDLLIIDICLSGNKKLSEGLEILKKIKTLDPDQEAIILTMYEEREYLMTALSSGAAMFLSKNDFTPSTVAKMVNMIIEKSNLQKRIQALRMEISTLEPFEIIGNTPAINRIKKDIIRAARDGEITVLITGETGTGKELVARNIHNNGIRKDGPFVAVAVSGLNKETINSELFGHEKDAFTGASSRKKGFFEEAHRGSLFLDEIGDLDLDIQVKLLRALENKSFTRMGSTREVVVDVQFIAATNRDLDSMVKEGTFREDLYYRLKAFEIHIPPLRERKEDIPLLIEHFLKQLYTKGRTTATDVSADVMDIFLAYNWPGNIRELKNVVEYAGIQARSDNEKVIKTSHLPEKVLLRMKEPQRHFSNELDYKKYLAEAELGLISRTIKKYKTRKKTDLARILHYPNRFTFMRRIKRHFNHYPELRQVFPVISDMFKEDA